MMKIKVRVVPNSKKAEIIEGEVLKVKIRSKPQKGKANKELIEVLSNYFGVPKGKIKIVSGEKSHNKVLEIEKT